MSTEELKIIKELEKDVERDLEEEIKDGIYHLALKLHRLYQHQKERESVESLSEHAGTKLQQGAKNKTLAELNINIRMEGGTKIEIKETKKEATLETSFQRPRSSRSENNQRINGSSNKKFNWENSLRSGPVIKKLDNSSRRKLLKGDHTSNEDIDSEKGRKNYSTLAPSKGNMALDKDLLDVCWKD